MKKQSVILTCSKNRPNAFLQFACKFITEDNAGIWGKKLCLESEYLFRDHPNQKQIFSNTKVYSFSIFYQKIFK